MPGSVDEDIVVEGGTLSDSVGGVRGTWLERRTDISCCRRKPIVPDIPLPRDSLPSHPKRLERPAFSSPLSRREGLIRSFSARSTMRVGGENVTPGDVDNNPALSCICFKISEKGDFILPDDSEEFLSDGRRSPMMEKRRRWPTPASMDDRGVLSSWLDWREADNPRSSEAPRPRIGIMVLERRLMLFFVKKDSMLGGRKELWFFALGSIDTVRSTGGRPGAEGDGDGSFGRGKSRGTFTSESRFCSSISER